MLVLVGRHVHFQICKTELKKQKASPFGNGETRLSPTAKAVGNSRGNLGPCPYNLETPWHPLYVSSEENQMLSLKEACWVKRPF